MVTEESNIYAFYCKLSNRVKIGHSYDLHYRFQEIQVHSPTTLEFVGYIQIRGARRVAEPVLHKILAKHRLHGEWFTVTDKAIKIMDIIRANDKNALINIINEYQYAKPSNN